MVILWYENPGLFRKRKNWWGFDMFTILQQLKCNEFPKAILLLPEKIVRFNMHKCVGTSVNKNWFQSIWENDKKKTRWYNSVLVWR